MISTAREHHPRAYRRLADLICRRDFVTFCGHDFRLVPFVFFRLALGASQLSRVDVEPVDAQEADQRLAVGTSEFRREARRR